MARSRRQSPRNNLSDLLKRCGEVLGGLERRQALIAEMRMLGERIDDAYAVFEKGPKDADAKGRIESTQAALLAQIEHLRVEADAGMTGWWDLHGAVQRALERAAVEESPLLPILERFGKLPLPDTANPVRHVLKLRALLQEAVSHLEPAPEVHSPVALSQTQAGGLLSAQQVASELGLSDKTVYRLAKEGRIPYVRIQSSLRFRRADLDHWLASKSFQLPAKRVRRSPV